MKKTLALVALLCGSLAAAQDAVICVLFDLSQSAQKVDRKSVV